jgi:choline transport protein
VSFLLVVPNVSLTDRDSIAVSIFYWIIAACIAELASAIPSTAGVYHWASVTPGKKYGRITGYYAGYWNYFGWIFGSSSASAIVGNLCVQLYGVTHPDYVSKPWHVFMGFIVMTWIGCLSVCYANRLMPYVNIMGIFFIVVGAFITVVVCAAMPGHGGRPPHASNTFVWKDWVADLGYPNGFVFLAGMLNGAYAVGTPDLVCHLAEEIPRPHVNVPKAVGLVMVIGFLTAFVYLIAILYAIHDFAALSESPFPLAEIYAQATSSAAGTIGLLFLALVPMVLTCIGSNITIGRGLWTLARDGATPFSGFLSKISHAHGMPYNATIACAILNTILGCIYLGSTTAFSALVGSFVTLTTASYTAAILPNLLTGRKNIRYGPFHMKGWLGFLINGIACAYMIAFFVIFCFPYYLPTDAKTMNYSSLICGGLTVFITAWYFLGGRKGYTGPQAIGGKVYEADMIKKVSEIVSKA